MKTLKKVLAVVLALAMVLGMAVTASATFTDAAEIGADYKEAVEVMNAVGVFVGSDGKMNPKANLTRAEAAKLITYLLVGEDTAEALPEVALYKDSKVSAWANKYIAYLTNEGVVAGVGAGKFNPTGNVTGYEFGKMLLGALGYKAEYEGLTGTNWAINTAKLMKSAGLVNKAASKKAANALTREEAAKYCFNALQSTMVEYEDAQTITVGNVQIATAKKADKVTEDKDAVNTAIGKIYSGTSLADDQTVELGEYLYEGKLTKSAAAVANNDLKRPAVKWEFEDKDFKAANGGSKLIGQYVETAADYTVVVDKTYDNDTKFVAGIAKLAEIDEDDTKAPASGNVYLNGASVAINALNNPGTVVELFMSDTDSDQIASLVAYTYQVYQVKEANAIDASNDKAKKYGVGYEYTVADYAAAETLSGVQYIDAKSKEIPTGVYAAVQAIGTFEEDDMFVAVLNNAGKLLDIQEVKTVNGVMTANGAGYVKLDGTKYICKDAAKAEFGTDFDTTFTAYLDGNGTIIWAEAAEDTKTSYNYGYVLDVDMNGVTGTLLKNPKVAIKVVATDGTTDVYSVPVVKATKAYGETIAKNDYYVTIAGVKVKLESATSLDGLEDKWISYDLDEEELTIAKFPSKNCDYNYGAVSADASTKKLTVAKPTSGNETYYMTASTKLVLVNVATGSAKTYTGYTKIEDALDGITGAEKSIVLTANKSNKATTVYVAYESESAYVDYTYGVLVATGDVVEDGTEATFFVDSENKEVKYVITNAGEVTLKKGVVYALDVDEKNVEAEALDTLKYLEVVSAGEDYVEVKDDDGDVVVYDFATECGLYRVADDGKSVATIEAKGLKADDKVVAILDESGDAVKIFKAVKNGTAEDFVTTTYTVEGSNNVTGLKIEFDKASVEAGKTVTMTVSVNNVNGSNYASFNGTWTIKCGSTTLGTVTFAGGTDTVYSPMFTWGTKPAQQTATVTVTGNIVAGQLSASK